jgi:hypothetical protein
MPKHVSRSGPEFDQCAKYLDVVTVALTWRKYHKERAHWMRSRAVDRNGMRARVG